ncbi:GATA zinc finger domain-containing protein 7 [Drosophila willistoni]|uniref:GATA zinc finger domain-containing protein 7 n=1 Tax=Drosophila willistoni TaxID=7260 RepID=UPI001F07AE32|nr:GATA zinc finger domain-containing protein 7 [Drosophila willistoni]
MFEIEEYSGIHEGFFNKYADAAGPSLDFYVSDSMQDMLDVDIRAEIANVVGGSSDYTSSLDNALEAISAINNNNNNNTSNINHSSNHNLLASSALHASPTAKWMGSCSNFWSTPDYYADVGACVNPISVMPLINSNSSTVSSMLGSPRRSKSSSTATQSRNTGAQSGGGGGSGSSGAVPSSPGHHKSHLTFSPAQMKVTAGSMRREQVMAHIPKQISVPLSSSVIADNGTTVPGTMATNSVLQQQQQQRRSTSSVDSVRKDLSSELRKARCSPIPIVEESTSCSSVTSSNGSGNGNGNGNVTKVKSNSLLTSGNLSTNTIKLARGIGGLTFANSLTYNNLKQQSLVKQSPGGNQTIGSTGQQIVLKREELGKRGLQMGNSNNNSMNVSCSTPKSIASAANSPHHQMQTSYSLGSPSPSCSSSSLASSSPLSNGSNLVNIANNSTSSSSITAGQANSGVKPLQQKIKLPPVGNAFPKPAYSYSCLIALALKNSRAGSLPVSEIYSFLCQHFPYFENAPSGWKNSVRHNLSLNKCFEKIERPVTNGNQRKGCRWAMNPERITKMDEEVQKWSRKDPSAIRGAMVYPEHLESLERGEMKHGSADSDVELDSQSEIEESSDLEEHDFEDTIVDTLQYHPDDDVDEEEELLDEFETEDDVTHNAASNAAIEHELLVQKNGDFDIEVDELYDAIDIEDDKEAVRRSIVNGGTHIIELNPCDLNANDGYQLAAKRARLDINYAIGPAGELEQQYGQKVKVQPVVQVQMQPTSTPTYNRRKMPLVNRII